MPATAKRNDSREAVLDLVRRALSETPGVGSKELQQRAGRVERAIGRLPVRVFHGRYVLPVVRSMKATRRGSPAAAKKTSGRRSLGRRGPASAPPARDTYERSAHVRAILLEFAQTIAGADTKTVVATIAQIDRYVERIIAELRN